ncbi:lachrymatory-factor synthase-like [Rosa sericea]
MGRPNLCQAQRLKSARGLASPSGLLQHGQVVPWPPHLLPSWRSFGQPGLVRYCERGTDETTILWAKKKLLTIDPINQCMTYEIVDNNMGFESYVATMQVVPINNHGCKIEWSFVCDQIEGTSLEDLQSFVESSLQGIARNMELALLSNTSTSMGDKR